MAKVNLSSPWLEHYHKITKLFGEDPDIRVIFNEEEYHIQLFVKGDQKANAINELLPDMVEFGNVTVKISVIPENIEFNSNEEIIKAAFKGNPVFSYVKSMEGESPLPITYAVFKNKVVQYFNDNLHDINGNKSTLYQNIADEVLTSSNSNIFYCTDIE